MRVINLPLPERAKPVIGALLCAILAAAVALMGENKPGKSVLPIWFLAVLMVAVFVFGSLAGILGTILSGIIFATYLFEPLGRLAVHETIQKNNLMWMVVIGLALSLFGRPSDKNPASSNENIQK